MKNSLEIIDSLNELIEENYNIISNNGFNCKPIITQLLLIVSEVGEAMELVYSGQTDDLLLSLSSSIAKVTNIIEELRKEKKVVEDKSYLPDSEKESYGEELADVIIRTLNHARALNIDIATHIVNKIEKNSEREFLHGKKF